MISTLFVVFVGVALSVLKGEAAECNVQIRCQNNTGCPPSCTYCEPSRFLPDFVVPTDGMCSNTTPACGIGPYKANTSLPQYLIIGDSISYGYSPFLIKNLTGKYEAQHVNTNADNSYKGVMCLSTWLGSHKWDLISFNFGLHDLAQDIEFLSVSKYTEYIMNITDRLLATEAKILWVATTPVPTDANLEPKRTPEDVIRYNAAAAAIMAEKKVPIDDLYGWVIKRCGPNYKTCEGIQLPNNVHFYSAGYQYLVESLVHSIDSL
jgi:hypothetical protein